MDSKENDPGCRYRLTLVKLKDNFLQIPESEAFFHLVSFSSAQSSTGCFKSVGTLHGISFQLGDDETKYQLQPYQGVKTKQNE